MKSVLISIQPKWCDMIANGEKTIEVRKTKPKLKPPFKCYIYCTVGGIKKMPRDYLAEHFERGKVIGEFVCDRFIESFLNNNDAWFVELGCLTTTEINEYQGDNPTLYGWHISDLVIYDKPIELSLFTTEGDCDCLNCSKCPWFDGGNGYNVEADCNLVYEYLGTGKTLKPLFRPPQSWCYVEEGADNG